MIGRMKYSLISSLLIGVLKEIVLLKVLIVDSDKKAVNHLEEMMMLINRKMDVDATDNVTEAYSLFEKTEYNLVLMDVVLQDGNGMDFARKIVDLYKDVNIIFMANTSEYALESYQVYASDYLIKPITEEQLKRSFMHLRYPVEEKEYVQIHCFGYFDLFYKDEVVDFGNAKSKELLAYLVDRNGGVCTNEEIMEVLWEDDKDHTSYYKKVRSNLIHTLKTYGIDNILVVNRGAMCINKNIVKCDYYDWLETIDKNDEKYYVNEYMSQYSWAEERVGIFQ